jgi:tetratricopeptide (TPR) repeat protein
VLKPEKLNGQCSRFPESELAASTPQGRTIAQKWPYSTRLTSFYNRGFVLCMKGDLDGALREYNEAIRLKPDEAKAFYNRGLLRRAKRDFEGAQRDFE